ncbi:MAG: DUF2255 family protein [Bryobacteraceae bacterium]
MWDKGELNTIAHTDDLHISPLRDDGTTYGTTAGLTKEVAFEPAGGTVNERIDEAYRAKYQGSPYLSAMIGPRARAATAKVLPRTNRQG